MERTAPRLGNSAALVSASQFLAIILNGLLGWFPAGILGTGDRGQKFHLYQYIRQKIGVPYKENGFWSDAGTLTGQEYAMIVVMAISLGVAIYGLRPRPLIVGPSKTSAEQQREELEVGGVGLARPSGLSVVNPTTAAIVSSVVRENDTPADAVISAALGEMTAVAVEMGVDEELVKGTIIQPDADETTHDSRFTTSVSDEDDIVDLTGTTEETSEESNESTDVDSGWLDDDDWLPDNKAMEPTIPETPAKAIVAKAATWDDEKRLPSLPSIPGKTEAVVQNDPEPVQREVKPVVPPTKPARREEVQMDDFIPVATPAPTPPNATEAHVGSMPIKPSGLPKMAEWDLEKKAWTLFGRPIEFSEAPPAPAPTPTPVPAPAPAPAAVTNSPPTLPKVNRTGLPNLPEIPSISRS